MKRLAVLGASGHGKVVADAGRLAGWFDVVFYDDAWPACNAVGPWAVIGGTAALIAARETVAGVLVAIGDNPTRLTRQRELAAAGLPIVSIVHPAAVVSESAVLGAGSVVFAGAVVNPFATLGEACIVNTGATIDHDCVLGDAVHVSPGAHIGGGVRVGQVSWIGIGSVVKHGIAIGSRVRVGAGAAVVQDVADGLTVIGVPARPVREHA